MSRLTYLVVIAPLFCIQLGCLCSTILKDSVVVASFSEEFLTLQVGTTKNVSLLFSQPLPTNVSLVFTYTEGTSKTNFSEEHEFIDPLPDVLHVDAGSTDTVLTFKGKSVGTVIVGLNSTSMAFTNLSDADTHVTVVHSEALVVVNAVIGWIYFLAWSVSFYPQVIYNFRRKSVIGLNFDFLAYNLTGFIAYGIFNVGMYWIDDIKMQYHAKYPHGVNPVQLNDVIFALHAALLTMVTIFQCFIYERGGQRISRVSLVILAASWVFIFITLFLGVGHVISWLDFLYYFSYVKLGVTLIKYFPQARMNYLRKSTEGWSIGNVLLDFTGGSFSLLQMFLISYNNDDWSSIFGDPTKFGLGFFSILFDILFMVQHYVLYRHNTTQSGYEQINGVDAKEA